jgi:predicted nuclease of predicted toxin-antitoxin system
MLKFLLDAALSPETANFLQKLGYDTEDLISLKLHHLIDEEVIRLAKRKRRIIVTFDLDFGQLYHFKFKGKVGIIILRLKNQTVESVNETLKNFLRRGIVEKQKLEKSLIVVTKTEFRVY